MNKIEKKVTINEENKAEKTNVICPLINSVVIPVEKISFLYKNPLLCKPNKIDTPQGLSGIVVYLLLLVWYD